MRQIKFRAWDIYGKRFRNAMDFVVVPDTGLPHWIHDNEYLQGVADQLILNQFTGLLDKTGKEVYEGDIIRFTQHLFNVSSNKWPKKTKVVKWLDWEGKWNLRETNAGESNFEVIGNIYETPNLILLP